MGLAHWVIKVVWVMGTFKWNLECGFLEWDTMVFLDLAKTNEF
jgi:hypothetical protein